MTTKGIVYIALGEDHLKLAIESIKSICDTSKEIYQFYIVTDCGSSSIIKNNEIIVLPITPISNDLGISSAYLKTQLFELSPFDVTLFLDTDVRAVADISKIWSYCGNRIAVSKAFSPIKEGTIYSDKECEETQRQLSVIGDFTQYNTGVFLFRKSLQTRVMFADWEEEWCLFKHHENMAFNRLVAQGMAVDYLLAVYNDFFPNRCHQSILVHYNGNSKKYLNA